MKNEKKYTGFLIINFEAFWRDKTLAKTIAENYSGVHSLERELVLIFRKCLSELLEPSDLPQAPGPSSSERHFLKMRSQPAIVSLHFTLWQKPLISGEWHSTPQIIRVVHGSLGMF